MPPRKANIERNLPPIKNELMTGEVEAAVLSSKCRVQDVRFGPADEEGTTETFVRIKTQIPHATMPHFIMRKAADDYISATSMYRAVFYKSTTAQEKHEMEVIKKELAARSDENASGVWIPGTPDALQLAEVYGIRPWVQALLDAPTKKSSYPEDQRSPSAPKSSSPVSKESSLPPVAETPSRKSTRDRSQSPRKTLAASSRKVKKAAKDVVGTINEDVNEVAEAVKKSVQSASKKVDTAKTTVDSHIHSPISVPKGGKPSEQVAELAEELLPSKKEVKEKISATVTSVGQSVTDMVAEARAQVEAAQKTDADALQKSGLGQKDSSSGNRSKNKKKRELEVEEEGIDAEGQEEDGVREGTVSVKRSRVEDLEVVLVQERRKVRALFGLVVGLGVTAVLPYVL